MYAGFETFRFSADGVAPDHSQRVARLTLLDFAPRLAMDERRGEACARACWHWLFLIRCAPLPGGHCMAQEQPQALPAEAFEFFKEQA